MLNFVDARKKFEERLQEDCRSEVKIADAY